MPDVWVTFGAPDTCQCWRDAVGPHGWTWQENEDHPCDHIDYFEPVHRSLADAVRSLFCINGAEAIGCLLRERYRPGGKHEHATRSVYVMPAGSGPFIDDHDADEGPSPMVVIARYTLNDRSTPRNDAGNIRRFANGYRDR